MDVIGRIWYCMQEADPPLIDLDNDFEKVEESDEPYLAPESIDFDSLDAQLQEGLAEVARIDVDAYECDDTEEQDPVADVGVIEGID